MLSSGKQVSIYYQGDNDSKKGWRKIEPVRIEGEGDDKAMVAYEIEGLGKKAVLKKYVQKKITNWNVLSTTPATIAAKDKEKEKKAPKKPGAKPPTPQKLNLGRQGDGICDAIVNKRIVRMEYMGDEEEGPGWREDVEPVCYGSTKGVKYIRAWVGRGVSVSAGKNPEKKTLPGWRFFRQDRIKKWEVDATKTFNKKRPDFQEGQDALISNIICVADFSPDEPSEPKDLSTTLKESAMLSAIKEAINIF
jgi:predicted DNA-binding transcriptional regulator YafY